MFEGAKYANQQMILDPSLSQGLINQQMHPFQPHLPTTKHEGEALPPYQSIKKAVPMMYQDNIELMDRNNNFNPFPNPALSNNPSLLPLQGGYAIPPNPTFPQQYQQAQPLQPSIGSHNIANSSGGLMYYNQKDFSAAQKIQAAEKLERESYTCILFINLFLFVAWVGAFMAMRVMELNIFMLGPLIGGPYLIYLMLGLMMNKSMPAFFNNLKESTQIEKSFQAVKVAAGDLMFHANCFHRKMRRIKQTTHTAKSTFPLSSCIDESSDFTTIKKQHMFIVATASVCFHFEDMQSQIKFLTAFKTFKDENRKDTEQQYRHAVNVWTPNLGQPFTICMSGTGWYLKPLYYLFVFLGLAYPFTLFIECQIGRYKLNSLKRLRAA